VNESSYRSLGAVPVEGPAVASGVGFGWLAGPLVARRAAGFGALLGSLGAGWVRVTSRAADVVVVSGVAVDVAVDPASGALGRSSSPPHAMSVTASTSVSWRALLRPRP
jgi:hypothetical protein